MGNAYPASGNRTPDLRSLSALDDEDEGSDAEMITLLDCLIEENTRLRALVVQLSDLVLRNVAGRT